MKNLKNSKTYENLARAFAGECQAHVRYMFIEYGEKRRLRRVVRNHRQSGLRRIQSRTHALFIPANRRRKRHQKHRYFRGLPFQTKMESP
mgnify:CR=1 FL=1